jgi:ERCC4-type nuclease
MPSLQDLANLTEQEMEEVYGIEQNIGALINEVVNEINSLRARVQTLEDA